LDELPELWNVFLGHMSLVGPRPLLTRYLPFYTDAEKVRFNVRPGITGWAQVNGRNLASWNTRLSLDIWYVSNQSFLLDLKIIFITLVKVFKTDGVVADPSTLMKNLDEERSTAG
jgi:lipopolysaccharide/colanic/teichoic acid biosynthesis glycosyltransferase